MAHSRVEGNDNCCAIRLYAISLNTGANRSLMYQGVAQGVRTVDDALGTERKYLAGTLGLDGGSFDFPTNGSGASDSRATPRTTATLLATMSRGANATVYRNALSILGIGVSLAAAGKTVAGKENILARSGATIDASGQLVAINMAGYINAKSGRQLAYALFVNHDGPASSAAAALDVFNDEADILGIVYLQYCGARLSGRARH
ncbi:hypothetical protein AB6809_35310 [Paraburkholderia sp. RCC_158]|uniref:hypothetical protein n=1 Tax=Paraburkholderia sp. RCC_158 TaxID=3239220 RepID=UPI0035246F48